jgi:hypothetical protein
MGVWLRGWTWKLWFCLCGVFGRQWLAGHDCFTILITSHFGVAMNHKRITEASGGYLALASDCYLFD